MAQSQMGFPHIDGCSIRIWLKVAGFQFQLLENLTQSSGARKS